MFKKDDRVIYVGEDIEENIYNNESVNLPIDQIKVIGVARLHHGDTGTVLYDGKGLETRVVFDNDPDSKWLFVFPEVSLMKEG